MSGRSGGPNGKTKELQRSEQKSGMWESLSCSLRDRGYAIVTDGIGSWIVRSGADKVEKPRDRDTRTKKTALSRKNDSGGHK